jgi:iron complex outermembrane recepter protein
LNFVGADGRARTADDSGAALGLLEEGYSKVDPPFGVDKFRWIDLYKIWRVYQDHPGWFVRNLATEHNNLVNGSSHVDEVVGSAFVRVDGSFFRNRLNVIGGVRMQDYRVSAESGEVNNLGRYLRDEEGNPILNAQGQPIVGTGTAVEVAERSNIERGILTKGRSRGYYPSFNASYRLRDNVQLRLGYAHSVNYPEVNQVAAQTTVTDITANPRRVTANSPLKPWFGKNYDLDVEYYTRQGGAIVVSFFRKEITDFIRQQRHLAGTPEARAALEKYGYGGLAALNFEVLERANGGEATYDGWDLDLRQTLDAYVPEWARGFNVFFNTSYTAAPKGVNGGDISAQSTRLMNWGVNFQRGRFGVRMKWNHVPEPKRVTPNNTHPVSRTFLDLDLSYRLREHLTVFASGANVMSVTTGNYIYTANTPDYARRGTMGYYGVQCTAGIKGQF